MPGPTEARDQSEDPRESTVDLPRLDVGGLADYLRGAPPLKAQEPVGLLEPLPDQEPAPRPGSRLGPGDLSHPYPAPAEPRQARGPVAPSAAAASTVPPTPAPDPIEVSVVAPATQSSGTPAAGSPQESPPPRTAVTPPIASPPPASAPAAETTPPAARLQAPPTPAAAIAPSPEPLRAAPASDRSAARPARLDRPARFGATRRAPAGSLADLRARLARLPAGHPSSPYEDDGRARPLPIRLKQLELGLPAPDRDQDGSLTPDVEAADPLTASPDVAAGVAEPRAPDLAAADQPAAAGARGAPSSAPSEPTADLALGPWQAAPPTRATGLEGLSARGGNGHGPSNGHAGASRGRTGQVGPDLPPRRLSDTDRRDTVQHQVVEPSTEDLRTLLEQTMATCRAAEGRDVFGSYGASGLTPAMQRLAAHLPFGGLAPDSEANSLKSPERLAAKLSRLIARNPGRTGEELAGTIGDIVRYAFVFEAADYVEGTWLVHRRLKSHGFELEIRRNRWESPEYKGIFTQWRDPAHHIAFEVQFHTTASWAVVQRTHDAYVQITDPATPHSRRAELRAQQVAAAAAAKSPASWAEINDFRLEAR